MGLLIYLFTMKSLMRLPVLHLELQQTTRAALVGISLKVRTNLVTGARVTPASMPQACSSVGSVARTSICSLANS